MNYCICIILDVIRLYKSVQIILCPPIFNQLPLKIIINYLNHLHIIFCIYLADICLFNVENAYNNDKLLFMHYVAQAVCNCLIGMQALKE